MNLLNRVQHHGWQSDRAQRGSNLVELALIMPLLLLLLAAIADFGRAFNHYIVITNSAREGARLGARMEQTDTIDEYILGAVLQEASNSGVHLTVTNSETSTITIEPDRPARQENEPITVTVEYSMTTIFTGLVGLDTIPMRSRSVMVMFAGVPPTPVPTPVP
jgi:Flp pilus assembly protein TadG